MSLGLCNYLDGLVFSTGPFPNPLTFMWGPRETEVEVNRNAKVHRSLVHYHHVQNQSHTNLSSSRGSGSRREDAFPACAARAPCLGVPLALLACNLASAACNAAARGSAGRLPLVSPEGVPVDDPSTVCPPECVVPFEQSEPIQVR